jgi:hypothetical protein
VCERERESEREGGTYSVPLVCVNGLLKLETNSTKLFKFVKKNVLTQNCTIKLKDFLTKNVSDSSPNTMFFVDLCNAARVIFNL